MKWLEATYAVRPTAPMFLETLTSRNIQRNHNITFPETASKKPT